MITIEATNSRVIYYKKMLESPSTRFGTLEKNKKYTAEKVKDDTKSEWFYIPSLKGFVKRSKVKIIEDKSSTTKTASKSEAEAKSNKSKTTTKKDVINNSSNKSNETVALGGVAITSVVVPEGSDLATGEGGSGGSGGLDIDLSTLTYEADLNKYDIGADIESYLDFKQIDGVFGMPYQYTPTVDRRLSGSKSEMEYGRKFSEKILMNAPLLFLTPGRPQFMAGYSDEYKQKILQKLYDMGAPVDDDLTDIKDGRYYTFKFAYDEYYSYVNTMIQRAACILGIGDEKFKGVPLSRYNWANYKNNNLGTFISGSEYVCFYIESENQVSESFNNSTGDSAIASNINQLSDLGKEAAFLLGNAAGYDLDAAIKSGYQNNLQAFSNFFNKWGGNGAAAIANKLFGGVSALAMGGHLAFPEIWKDSDYTQPYNITIKLASPDGDKYSQFINIMVPYYHLLGFVLPQALGYNGYTSPFLVRASYGGVFNCEMGIITSLDVSKGPSWNQYKMPTEISVSLTIKDLYKALYMNNETSTTKFLKNSQFVDFLANSVGVNMNMPEIGRTLNMYKSFLGGRFNSAINNIENSMSNFLSNQVSKLKIMW